MPFNGLAMLSAYCAGVRVHETLTGNKARCNEQTITYFIC